MDKRAQKESEQRLAFVYLIKVSDVVAVEIAAKQTLKLLMPSEELEKLTHDGAGTFGPSHKVSAMLAQALLKISVEEVRADPNLKVIPRFVKSQLEAAKDFKLTAEQLAKLPKDVVFASNRFQMTHAYVMQCVEMWGAFFENNERYWVTAEGIHDQWMSVVRFVQAARELRLALIRFGAADHKQATDLLSKQIGYLFEVLLAKWADQPKLAAASAGAQKAAVGEPTA